MPLRSRNLPGRRNAVVIAAIKAAVRLGDRAAPPYLHRLARRPLLYRKRRRPVWHEAQRALIALKASLSDPNHDAGPVSASRPQHESIAA